MTGQPLAIRVVRAVVEATALLGLAWWGWTFGNGLVTRLLLAVIIAAVTWWPWVYIGTPGDPARRMQPLVAIAGPGRLLLEVTILGFAAYAIWTTVSRASSETFMTVAVVLYAVTWDRQFWLLRQ